MIVGWRNQLWWFPHCDLTAHLDPNHWNGATDLGHCSQRSAVAMGAVRKFPTWKTYGKISWEREVSFYSVYTVSIPSFFLEAKVKLRNFNGQRIDSLKEGGVHTWSACLSMWLLAGLSGCVPMNLRTPVYPHMYSSYPSIQWSTLWNGPSSV